MVDDNKDAADSLQLLLQALGQDVYAVYDGATAVHAINRQRPHVAILDIGMPRMSGYEVVEQVRSTLGKDVPVFVAVTGWGQRSDKDEALKRGFKYHFTKPVSAAALHEVVTAISKEKARRS
ncbi:MAG: response regulator [Gammaproteobacteria bacterium]